MPVGHNRLVFGQDQRVLTKITVQDENVPRGDVQNTSTQVMTNITHISGNRPICAFTYTCSEGGGGIAADECPQNPERIKFHCYRQREMIFVLNFACPLTVCV